MDFFFAVVLNFEEFEVSNSIGHFIQRSFFTAASVSVLQPVDNSPTEL